MMASVRPFGLYRSTWRSRLVCTRAGLGNFGQSKGCDCKILLTQAFCEPGRTRPRCSGMHFCAATTHLEGLNNSNCMCHFQSFPMRGEPEGEARRTMQV